jgi:hypothetical protein
MASIFHIYVAKVMVWWWQKSQNRSLFYPFEGMWFNLYVIISGHAE